MDFQKVIDARLARQSRDAIPYRNFADNVVPCFQAGQSLLNGEFKEQHRSLVERAVVIDFVTYLEVYYRDALELILRLCTRDFVEAKLNELHPYKYSIKDIVQMRSQDIDPLELIVSDMSFQNAEKIEKVFAKFLGCGFWNAVINVQIRRKSEPETTIVFEGAYLEQLKRVFKLRHELVHNPKNMPHLTSQTLNDIRCSSGLVLASDTLIQEVIATNLAPEFDNSEEENTS